MLNKVTIDVFVADGLELKDIKNILDLSSYEVKTVTVSINRKTNRVISKYTYVMDNGSKRESQMSSPQGEALMTYLMTYAKEVEKK
jgi:hypothetical protein